MILSTRNFIVSSFVKLIIEEPHVIYAKILSFFKLYQYIMFQSFQLQSLPTLSHYTPSLVIVRNECSMRGTDIGFLCFLSRTNMLSHKGPRVIDSKMNVYGEVLCARLSPFVNSIILVGFSTGSLAIYNIGYSNPIVVLTPPASSRKPVNSVEWSPISSVVFYSIHGHTRLLVWDLSRGHSPQSVNDLYEQTKMHTVMTRIWLHKVDNSSSKGIANLALGLKEGIVEVHSLETAIATKNGSLLDVLSKLNK
ncbi:hypothetical protein DICVIV_03072 [Dictyocaulus viviparus]|uniref:WD domain, G-beta repeat protein n=1 Tax=Dictyocaulus viviparus TaxID=29172 RepID=A0A0D8Y833_DICVI|nr:hypothetical protein DICVIV_03072 [Dictyocaulus viviparus]